MLFKKYRLGKVDYLLIAVCFLLLVIFAINKIKTYFIIENVLNNSKTTSLKFSQVSNLNAEKIKQGEYLHSEFYIINTGINKLYVGNFKSSCGCTNIEISKRIINIKDSALVKVSIDTKNKNGLSESEIKFQANTNYRDHFYILKYLVE